MAGKATSKKESRVTTPDLPLDQLPVISTLAFLREVPSEVRDLVLSSDSMKSAMKAMKVSPDLKGLDYASKLISIPTLKDLERSFEASIDTESKKKSGAVYTPDFIIDFIIEECLIGVTKLSQLGPILDPACGSGGFLVRAAEILTKKFGISYKEASSYLYGIDVNPRAIVNARLLLDVACAVETGELSDAKVINADSLVMPVKEQLKELGIPDGVGALVTNPPYVKLQTLDENYREVLIKNYPDISSGAFSLATLFLFNAQKYLTKTGKAGFITLNNIFTSLAAESLREHWASTGELSNVVDFRHFTVFDASAYTCLIFTDSVKKDSFQFSAMSEFPTAENLKALNGSQIVYSELNAKKWRLGDSKSLALVSAMEKKGKRLGSELDIKVGFATLQDKAFMGSFVDGKPVFVGKDQVTRTIEAEAIRRFIKVSELKEVEISDGSVRAIIYPYRDELSDLPLIPFAEFKKLYPLAFAHLNTWREELEARVLRDGTQWHQWGRRQSLTAKGPKLLTKTFDARPTFRLDGSDGLFCNGYSLRMNDSSSEVQIEDVKRFLESRFVHAYALITSFEIAGGYQCYQKNFIENICLPTADVLTARNLSDAEYEKALGKHYGITKANLEAILKHYLT